VVVKVCSAAIPHKTEVGGVVLNVRDVSGLDAALATLPANLAERAPGVPWEQVLVQPVCSGLAEVLLGYRVDAEAGPIVMLAAGGIWAEVARDRSIRLAPVTLEAAHEMIGEVRALKTLTGPRWRARAISMRWLTPSNDSRSWVTVRSRASWRPRSTRCW
jgi:hypothetical protein